MSRNYANALYLLTGVFLLAGLYFRIKGLGFSPLAIDEYYIATSVKSIVENGLPAFEGGGYYTRGLLVQYLVAPLFMSGLSHEVAFRLVTVIFNLAALPAVYLLTRNLAGLTAGCLAVVLFSVSVWEIEFARFARMYAPFGTLFLWHLYFLHRHIVLDDQNADKWMYLLTIVAVFTSEFAVFLALLNFLPLVLKTPKRPLVAFAVPTVILVVTYVWESINFRRLGVVDPLPPDHVIEGASGLPVHLPPVLLPELLNSLLWPALFLVPLAVGVAVAAAWIRWTLRTQGTLRAHLIVLVPIGIVLLGLLNLFGLVIYAVVISILLSPLSRADLLRLARRPLVLLSALSVALSLIFWSAYVANTDWWQSLLPATTGAHSRDALLLLFNYPNVFREVIVPWRAAMPVQAVVMAGLIIAGAFLATSRSVEGGRGYRFATAVALGMFVLVPVFTTPYSTTRYTFFVYPLLLLLSVASIVYLVSTLTRNAAVVAAGSLSLVIGLMLVSEDFDSEHLLGIDGERATYRMDYPAGKVDQYYTRWDFRGVAAYVNAALEPDHLVISAEYSVPYYLERLDYLYMDERGGRFEIIAAQQGNRDIWEGKPLLRTEAQLFRTIRKAPSDVWLIARSANYPHQTAGERQASERLDDYRVYRSVDGHLDVYRVPSSRPDARPGP